MGSATLFLLTSSMGVMFGWQPMPDGSPRYEYIVQLEPELAATLKAGQSIPISSEVPDDIRPIGRIRVTVGSNPLPRQKLSTALKPLSESLEQKPLDGVIRTQYTVPPVKSTGAGRYPAQPQANNQPILPPNGAPNSASQGFSQALQSAAQAKEILPPQGSNNYINTVQNSAQDLGKQLRSTSNEILPNSQQLFGNNGSVTKSFEQTGQQVRGAIENAGQQAQNSFNQLTNQNTQPPAGSNTAILPPNGQGQRSIIAGPISPPQTRTQQPVDAARSPSNWKSFQSTATNNQPTPANPPATASSANNFNSSWPGYQKQQTAPGTLQPPPLANPSQQKGFNSYERYARNPTRPADQVSPITGSAPNQTTGPALPLPPTANTGLTNSTVPTIRESMLTGPADAELESARHPSAPAILNPQQATQQDPTTQLTSSKSAADYGWEIPNKTGPQAPVENQPTERSDSIMLALSWVLLCSSGFGNVYLLWNYFDVRHKYRGLVHNARDSSRAYSSLD